MQLRLLGTCLWLKVWAMGSPKQQKMRHLIAQSLPLYRGIQKGPTHFVAWIAEHVQCGCGCRLGLCSGGHRVYGTVSVPVWRHSLPGYSHGHSGALWHMRSAAQDQRTTWQAPHLMQLGFTGLLDRKWGGGMPRLS